MMRDFGLERHVVYTEIMTRLAWSDFRRVQELFRLLALIRQDEAKSSRKEKGQ